MFDWWDSLTLELQIFYGAAIIASAVVAIQMILQLIGFDADGADGAFDVDMGDI